MLAATPRKSRNCGGVTLRLFVAESHKIAPSLGNKPLIAVA